MPRFIRVVRQARWSRPPWTDGHTPDWQGDALTDLSTMRNSLSVYQADSDEMVHQVIAGFAANRDRLANVDYAMIESHLLDAMNLQIVSSDGETPHAGANRLHHDIVNLTADNVLRLVRTISADDVRRVPARTVRTFIQRALTDGQIDATRLRFSVG